MFGALTKKLSMPTPDEALKGRTAPVPTAAEHFIYHRPLVEDVPEGCEVAVFWHGVFLGR